MLRLDSKNVPGQKAIRHQLKLTLNENLTLGTIKSWMALPRVRKRAHICDSRELDK